MPTENFQFVDKHVHWLLAFKRKAILIVVYAFLIDMSCH